ncbi:hypothetical protein TcG_06105 [Trypanosoma cruzi]|uniref:FYVE-type domain-containing protein n=2 Tax=Trypanosoma cruzi TaxID=5693 RepID=V5DE45_TRYCR|nr:hypothetical protein TCDM_05868 [Trypanosoma cruzi Dm28c]PBJ68122.1 hypothetical protein BCY84_22394 [Trypanosoma cruzi cruzi]PWU87562.1 hypothetical protein C4B63_89g51 [Trypanosoma cruzi]RNF16692.1 hypothetical protein TcG_06105 [Trypanosoma cruzi]
MNHSLRILPQHEWYKKSEVSACQNPGCGRSFSLFNKPENCHACGMVMCTHCLKRQLTLPGHPGSAPVPLCHACAICVAKLQAEAENAYHQQGQLLNMLNEQREELERLLAISSSLREENQQLISLTEVLRTEVEQPMVKSGMDEALFSHSSARARRKSSSQRTPVRPFTGEVNAPADDGDDVFDGPTAASANSSSRTATVEGASLAEELRAKQRMLSRREEALQASMKKVTSDATRIAAQRMQLQEEEKKLRARMAQEFQAIVEEECRRLQNVYMEELTTLGEQFAKWRRNADEMLETVRLREHRNTSVELSTVLGPENTVQAVKCEHATDMTQQEEAYKAKIAHLEELLRKVQKRFDDDNFMLQSALGVARREVEMEKRRFEASQRATGVLTLKMQEEQQRYELTCTELRGRLETMHFFHVKWQQLKPPPPPTPLSSSLVLSRQDDTKDRVATVLCTALSGWRCVAEVLLSQHSASLSAATLFACTACSLAASPLPSSPTKKEALAKISALAGEDEQITEPRCELGSARRLSKVLEDRANEHALEAVSPARTVAPNTEELQQLRERLSRTERALVRASGIEKQLSQQLQQQREREKNEGPCAAQGESSASVLRLAAHMMYHAGLYMDGCFDLLRDALLRRYDAGVQIMHEELLRRRELMRRNTVALEQTTASMKIFQEGLKQRESAALRTEEALRAWEQDTRLRLFRLMKVSAALRMVAERLRVASTNGETNRSRDGTFL